MAHGILWDLQRSSKLKPYITQLIRPGERGRTDHSEVKQCNLDVVSVIHFARQTGGIKTPPSPNSLSVCQFGGAGLAPTKLRQQQSFACPSPNVLL